jgi:hypothetical protein
MCSSVLLTSYIPVLIIGYAIQLALTVLMPTALYQIGKVSNVKTIINRKIIKGIIWPEYWADESDSEVATENRTSLDKDPTILLSSKSIICFDVLNNIMIMLTFGLCSPLLAAARTVVVVCKMHMWMMLLGRFTAQLHDSKSITDIDTGTGADTGRSGELHFAVMALARVPFPVTKAMQQCFWLVAGISSVFVAMVAWDIAGDDVGWERSAWIPVVGVSYPMLLWLMARWVGVELQDETGKRKDNEKNDDNSDYAVDVDVDVVERDGLSVVEMAEYDRSFSTTSSASRSHSYCSSNDVVVDNPIRMSAA